MADQNDDTTVVDEGATEVDAKQQGETDDIQGDTTSNETTHGGEQTEGGETGSTFDKRFTQFKGETPEEYAKNLEDGYQNSSQEALRLKKQLDELRAEKLSEVAQADGGKGEGDGKQAQQPQSITDMWASQEMQRQHREQYGAFAAKHPEVNEDDDLFQKLDEETGKYMDYVHKTQNRVPELAESLNFAWKILRPDDTDSRQEQVATAAKSAGSASKTKSVAKDTDKPQFSDKAIETARRIDPKLRDKSRIEIEEILAKYK